MDIIERWLGLSPDGGNGTAEVLLAAVLAAIALAVLAARRKIFARRD
jgi:hypothetical protein